MQKINFEDFKIKEFLEANKRYFIDKFFDNYTPEYIKEQVIFRLEQCKDDCVKTGQCKYCGCPTKVKSWATTSCNKGERFPDLMDKPSWEKYKEEKL